jgi:hypothetical protein
LSTACLPVSAKRMTRQDVIDRLLPELEIARMHFAAVL